MNCSSQISYNIMVSYFKWRHSLSYGKIPFTLRKCIHVCAITSHKIHLHLPLKFIEIDELLSICFITTVNQAATSFKNFNFTSDVSIHAIVTCQDIFLPVPAFAEFFSYLHGFSDASNSAYAAVVYIKAVPKYEIISVTFVTFKVENSSFEQIHYHTAIRAFGEFYFVKPNS